jgi:hypothetical protein
MEINIFLGAFHMEILLGAIIVVAGLYYIWAKAEKAKNAGKEAEAPYKVEAPATTVTVVGGDIAFQAPAEAKAEVATKPAKKPRATKPKAAAITAKPKAEAKPKAPRKPKMKVAK